MPDRRPMTGLLLAGGRSLRMGSDKARLEVDGETLTSRGLRALSVVCDELLVASGDGRRLTDILQGTDARQVADVVDDAGPLGGIAAGLAAATHDLVAVLAVDAASPDPGVLRLLAAWWKGEAAVAPVAGGRPQPLHAVWSAEAAGPVSALLGSGERSVLAVLRRLDARFVEAPPGAPGWDHLAGNLNRPGDLPP